MSWLDALILDVKTGSGAFMPTLDRSRELAESLVDVANGAGCKTGALIGFSAEAELVARANGFAIAEMNFDHLLGLDGLAVFVFEDGENLA